MSLGPLAAAEQLPQLAFRLNGEFLLGRTGKYLLHGLGDGVFDGTLYLGLSKTRDWLKAFLQVGQFGGFLACEFGFRPKLSVAVQCLSATRIAAANKIEDFVKTWSARLP